MIYLQTMKIFQGIGRLDGIEIKLNIDERVTVLQTAKIIPLHIRKPKSQKRIVKFGSKMNNKESKKGRQTLVYLK